MEVPPYFVGMSVALFGLLFGSFANVVIWRFPRRESLSVPGSHCPVCEAPIAWYDNVPVLSWLLLRGRCRGCGTRISMRYPAVELLSGALWFAAWLEFGWTARLPLAIAFLYLLMILSFIDLDTMRLPNPLVALLAAIGVGGVAVSAILSVPVAPLLPAGGPLANPAMMALAGVVAGAGPALVMSLAYASLRGSQGLGMGDVKLLAAMGLYLGLYAGLALFIGSIIGVAAAVAAQRAAGPGAKVPFGPSLALAAAIIAVWGPELITWYTALL